MTRPKLFPEFPEKGKTMKKFLGLVTLFTTFIVLSGTVVADPLRLIMGDEGAVKDALASKVYYINAGVITGGIGEPGKGVGRVSYGYYSITGFQDMCAKMRTHAIKTCQSVITNGQASIGAFKLSVATIESDIVFPDSFRSVTQFQYVWDGHGYSVPSSISEVTPSLREELTVLETSGLTWARVEITNRNGTVKVFDSIDDREVRVVDNNYLRVQTPIVVTGTNATTVTVFLQENGRFHKFDGRNGMEVPLDLPRLSIGKSGNSINLSITGDPYQGFVVESTDDFQTWKMEGYGITSVTNQWRMLIENPDSNRFFKVTPIGLSNAQRSHL